MRFPIDKLRKLVDGWRSPREDFTTYTCAIDRLPMEKVGNVEGRSLYQCPNGHTRIPGLDVGDKDGMIAKNSGDTKGEI